MTTAAEPPRTLPAEERPASAGVRSRVRAAAPWTAATAALVVATWLYGGYRYGVWPQPGYLANVLAFSGELENDWFTSLPAGHWAAGHALAVVPEGLRGEALVAGWGLFLAVLWLSFLDVCRSLGAPLHTGVAAGLVLIPTQLGGFGVSETLFGFFYPNGLSFALAVASLALLLRERFALAGAALGLSALVHPGLGPLAVAALGPMVLFARGRRIDRRAVVRFALPLGLFGLPPLIQLLTQTTAGATLTQRELYEFVAIVRQPHHVLYSDFPALEWVRSGLWAGALLGGLLLLARSPVVRKLWIFVATIAALCALGAVASEAGWPVMLVNAQTSRLSSFVLLVGAAAAAAALARRDARLATAALLAVFLLSPPLESWLTATVLRLDPHVGVSAVSAALVLAALVAVWLAGLPAARPLVARAGPAAGLLAPLAVALGLVATISLVAERDDRDPGLAPEDAAYREIGRKAQTFTDSGELVLTPPDLDGFRVFAERPVVVEFGSIRLGQGDDEWRRRIVATSGDPAVLDPDSVGTDVQARLALMRDGYQRTVAASPDLICRYDAKLVVTRRLEPTPPWLVVVHRNEFFDLHGIKDGTCGGEA